MPARGAAAVSVSQPFSSIPVPARWPAGGARCPNHVAVPGRHACLGGADPRHLVRRPRVSGGSNYGPGVPPRAAHGLHSSTAKWPQLQLAVSACMPCSMLLALASTAQTPQPSATHPPLCSTGLCRCHMCLVTGGPTLIAALVVAAYGLFKGTAGKGTRRA